MPDLSELTPATAAGLVRASAVALRGRVAETGASTEGVPAGDDTAVVAVEEIIHAPPTFPDVTGREVTIRLAGPARKGQHAVFFVQSWTYAATIGLIEVNRVGSLRSTDAARKLFSEAAQSEEARMHRERIEWADLVVVGTVREIRPAPEDKRVRIDTEHDPDWWEALVDVEETLKGDGGKRIEVLFPMSTDEIWIDSPKLERGLTAVFVLKRDQEERGGPGLWAPGLTALEPGDVRPVDDLERIRSEMGRKP